MGIFSKKESVDFLKATKREAKKQIIEAKKKSILELEIHLFSKNKNKNKKEKQKVEKANNKDLIIFFRQLAIMFAANVSIGDAFKMILSQPDKKFKLLRVTEKLLKDIEDGVKLSEAMSKFPKVFSKYHTNVIKSGEATGNLDEVLGYLADEAENNYEMMHKIKNSLTYPIFVLGTMGLVGILMMAFVVPKLMTVMTEVGGVLPLPTRILIATSSFFQRNIIFIFLFIVGIVFLSIKYYKTAKGRLFFDDLKLRVPVFGKIFKKMYLTRFTNSLFILIKSSVPIIESLKISSEIVGNVVYENIIILSIKKIEDGEKISSAFSTYKNYMPPMFIQMVSIGEKTGKLDYVLEKISAFYLGELKNIVSSLMTLMEPLIILLLGVGVAVIVAAILLPMYSLSMQF